ncbi:MAG TPA: LemA family protein [Sphingomicrobium sp.]
MTARRRFGLLAPLVALSLSGCGLNSVPTAEEDVNAKAANLQAEYQRRNDLIPNLVRIVAAGANLEKSASVEVLEARAKATSIQLRPQDLEDPAKVKAYGDAQDQVTVAYGRFIANVEADPDFDFPKSFQSLQDQYEGTENSVLVARRDYNEAVQAYNTRIRTFPDAVGAKIFYGAKPKVPFEASKASQEAPKVDFGNAS